MKTFFLALLRFGKDLEGLLGGERISDISEVDQINNLLRRHVCNNSPDWLAERLCPQVPDGVYNGTESEMDDALLGANPAELRVVDKMAPCLSPILDERF